MIPCFTVAIPTYDNHLGLMRLLDSIKSSSACPIETLVIDNAQKEPEIDRVRWVRPVANLGVATSWNLARRLCATEDLIICNDDVVVGYDTFQRLLETPATTGMAFLQDPMTKYVGGYTCFLLRSWFFEKLGPFDDCFYPAYYEDADYTTRFSKSGLTAEAFTLVQAPIDHQSAGRGHLKWVQAGAARNLTYFITKWGHPPR